MSAHIIIVDCRFCKGSGKAESLQERTLKGEWVNNTQLDHSIADAWIKADNNAPLRWISTKCPVCFGLGHYELESISCKIF